MPTAKTDRTKFGKDTDKVIAFLKTQSHIHRQNGEALSLSLLSQRVRVEFGMPKFVKPKPKPGEPKKKGFQGDPIRFVIWKLCHRNDIWFGKP